MILNKGKIRLDLHIRTVALAAGVAGGLGGRPKEGSNLGGVPAGAPLRSGEGWGRASVVAVGGGR